MNNYKDNEKNGRYAILAKLFDTLRKIFIQTLIEKKNERKKDKINVFCSLTYDRSIV